MNQQEKEQLKLKCLKMEICSIKHHDQDANTLIGAAKEFYYFITGKKD